MPDKEYKVTVTYTIRGAGSYTELDSEWTDPFTLTGGSAGAVQEEVRERIERAFPEAFRRGQ